MNHILTSALLAATLCPTMQAQSNEITYNAVIKDRKGAPAKSVTASQIEMTDGGTKVNAKVRLYDGDEVVDGTQRQLASPLRRLRLITVVFEGMDNEQRRLAKQIALDLFKEDKEPNHLFAVFMFTNQMSLLAPYTTNREELRKAVEIATSGSANTRFAEIHQLTKAKLDAAANASPQALTDADIAPASIDSNPTVQGMLARLQLGMLSTAVIDDGEGARRSITFLNALSTGLKAHPGRKPLAYLTWGMYLPPNLDVAFEALHARANSAGVSFYPIDCRGVNIKAQNAGVNAAVAANSVNLDNSGTENRERGDRFFGIDNAVEALRYNIQSALRVLAETTGGVMMIETNDPKRLLREMISDVQTYYELTYDPQIKDFNGAMRRTSLKVDQPGLKVRDRDGYLAMPVGQESLLSYELPLFKALGTTPLARDVEFRSGTWKLKATKERVDGVVTLEVPFAGVAFAKDATKGIYAAHLGLIAQIKDASGKVIEKFTRDLPLKGKLDQLEALKNSNFNYRERFSVPPGRYVIETAVIDQLSGKVGARKISFIGGAGSTSLALSSVTLVRTFQPNVKDLSPDDPFQYQGGRITPTLNNTLKASKTGQMAIFFTVYPDQANATAAQAVVQFIKDGTLGGSAQFQLPPADAQGRIRYVLNSPMETLTPGDYEVKIIVKQGTAAVAESVFLTIGT